MNFDSIVDCCKYFKEKYNIILGTSMISAVCLKRRNHYKGYHFEYINN